MSRSPIEPKQTAWVEQLAIVAESLISNGHTYDQVMGYDIRQVTAMSILAEKRAKNTRLTDLAIYRTATLGDEETVKGLINELTN